MRIFLALLLTAMVLTGCFTPEVKNVDCTFYAHNLSAKKIPVAFDDRYESTEESPSYFIFAVQKNILHEGELIIPKGSLLSCLTYYPENPKYFVVHAIQLSGNLTWTPSQGIVTLTTGKEGYATLSHVTIPR